MSQQPISLSPDLQRLRDEGLDLEIKSGYLLVKNVPFVNSRKEVSFGNTCFGADLWGRQHHDKTADSCCSIHRRAPMS